MKRARTTKVRSGRQAMSALTASVAVTLLAWGCGSSNEEKLRAAELAGSCTINSNCEDPYVCAFGRCHVECDEDRDCRPIGLRCMNAPEESGSVGVCQLPDEVTCEGDRDCPGDTQVCGIDNECRDPCEGEDDCTPTQICAKSDECASTDSDYDLIDEDGNIVAQSGSSGGGGAMSGGGKGGSSSGGRGGASAVESGGAGAAQAGEGGAGAAGSNDAGGGGSPSAGGHGGQGGTLGTAGSGGEGEGGDPSPGSGGASSGEAGMGGAGVNGAGMGGTGEGGGMGEFHTESPDGIEVIDNDTRENAVVTPLHGRATIHVEADDHDWFAVTVPDDGSPHVISLVIEQEPSASVLFRAITRINYAPIGANLSYGLGTTGYAYVTAGSGATILFDFSKFAGPATGGLARLTFDVEAENDAHEPNNTKETATLIEREQIYSGMISEPWISDLDRPDQDWYAIDLEVGTTTVGFTSVPSQGRITGLRVSPTGATTNMGANAQGASDQFPSFTVSEAGRYYIVFEPYTGIAGVVAGAKPTYLTQPYSFRVTQQ